MGPVKRDIRGFLGVVHVPAMPGDPAFDGEGFGAVELHALADAEALVDGGVDGLVIENFGSAPFPKGTEGHRLPPHHTAALAILARECRRRFPVLVGVNCLRNDARSAIGIAAAAGLDFVRINVHTGAYLTDQGVIEGEADRTLRYRRELGAESVAILADVMVKHASPLTPIDPARTVADTLERGLADGVIVTGDATGGEIDAPTLETVSAASNRPLFLGSGVTPENAPRLAPRADGAIVGTWLKEEGRVDRPVDSARVRELAAILGQHLRDDPSRRAKA